MEELNISLIPDSLNRKPNEKTFSPTYNGYFPITIRLDNGLSFAISCRATDTLHDLIEQVQAEYWFYYIMPKLPQEGEASPYTSDYDRTRRKEAMELGLHPLVVRSVMNRSFANMEDRNARISTLSWGMLPFLIVRRGTYHGVRQPASRRSWPVISVFV